jgi:hypothetical protein
MRSAPWARVALVASAIVAGAGTVDSVRHDQWDAVVLFAMLLVISLALLGGTYLGRPAVPIRADLARWLGATAASGGERTGDLADRAIAAYRSGLVPPVPVTSQDGEAHDD